MESPANPTLQQNDDKASDSVEQLLKDVTVAQSLLPTIRLRIFRNVCLIFSVLLVLAASMDGARQWMGMATIAQWAFMLTASFVMFAFYWHAKSSDVLRPREVQVLLLAVFVLDIASLLTNGLLPIYFLYPYILLIYIVQEQRSARWWAFAVVVTLPLAFAGREFNAQVFTRVMITTAASAVLMDVVMANVTAMALTFGRLSVTLKTLTLKLVAENERLDAANAAANSASVAKSEFLANMSHEIRTPMNAILGMLSLLRKTDLTSRQADYAIKSEGAARSLLGLLNEVLDYSKIEAGKMALDPHPFALEHLLRDLAVVLSSNLENRPVEVLFDIDPDVPNQLMGDAMRLQQVLLNLGSNAVKFTERGEIVLSIQVLERMPGAVRLLFSVRDTGIGIAPENQSRIFQSFTQAEGSTTRRFGGTGLGIAISQRFVALMGGELQVESALGKGSRFYFSATLAQLETDPATWPKRAAAVVGQKPQRVLVIDDNASAREVMLHMLQAMGWQADLVASGGEGMQLLQQGQSYNLILVDWNLPDHDGLQLCKQIRAMFQHADALKGDAMRPRVIMVTAYGRERFFQQLAADQAALDGFLVKPITAAMLLDAVIEADLASHSVAMSTRAVGATSPARLQGLRLLLVEDNRNNQQVAQELLVGEGAQVQIANHGKEAVEAVAAAMPAFDVVLMDLQMPVMDGFAAARTIRYDLGLRKLPIVAMTANAMASDREAVLAAGMNDHVGKPFDLDNLVRVIRIQAGLGEVAAPPSAVPLAEADALSASVQQAAERAGVDIQAAYKRLGGQRAVYQRTLDNFVQDLTAMPNALRAASRADVKRLLHTLKGLAATVGNLALAGDAEAVEKSLGGHLSDAQLTGQLEHICESMVRAKPGLQALLAALEQTSSTAVSNGTEQTAPLDKPALGALLETMAQMLQVEDFEVMNRMPELQSTYGAALGDALTDLEQAMADMAFDRALPLVLALKARYCD